MTDSTIGGTGGCLCGAVRYRYRGEPSAIGLCQCDRCQRQSGSAFLIALCIAYVAAENLFGFRAIDRYHVTFVFGLVHSFGFSNVVRDIAGSSKYSNAFIQGLFRCLGF